MRKLFTSESVTEGHPDKVCDMVSDHVLDDILTHDKDARVACEVVASKGFVNVMGEISSNYKPDLEKITRDTIKKIGYDDEKLGLDYKTCNIVVSVTEQSGDISMGVDNSLETRAQSKSEYDKIGAGDQGMMFGFACDETEELMPLAISLSHKLTKRLTQVRKENILPYLGPDGKAQVTVEYDDDKPFRVDTVVVSSQHRDNVSLDVLRDDIKKKVINYVLPEDLLDENTKFYINPTGRFVIGGPEGDVGLTGRKIIVDTYGGYARHGGGAFSGKDPTKVDRSATYMARYIAKNIVAAGVAKRCEVQIAYAIGVANPVSVFVDSFGTSKVSDDRLAPMVCDIFDLRPAKIIEDLSLKTPMYSGLGAYGHMGRIDLDIPWERTDKVSQIKQYLSE